MIDNMIVIIGKKNNNGSAVSLEFLHGVIKVDKNPVGSETDTSGSAFSEEQKNKKKTNLDIRYQELKNNSVHAVNDISDSTKIRKRLESNNNDDNNRLNSANK